MSCWTVLKIKPTSDIRAIKKAYAKCIKKANPEVDARGFQQIRTAYEEALEAAEAMTQGYDGTSSNDDLLFTSARYYQTWQHAKTSTTVSDADSNKDAQPTDAMAESETGEETDPAKQIALDFVKQIDNALATVGQEKAIEVFQQLCQDPALDALDNLYHFEGELLLQFYYSEQIPQFLLIEIANHFNWHQFDNPFQYDQHYNFAYPFVFQLAQQAQVRKLLAEQFPDLSEEQWDNLNEMLFEDVDQDQFYALYHNEHEHVWNNIFYYLFKELRGKPFSPISDEVIQWWISHSNPESWITQSEANDKQNKGGYGFWWFVFWFAVWIIVISIRDN